MKSWKLNQKGVAAGLLILAILIAGCGLVLINVANHVTGLKSFSETWPSTPGVLKSIETASVNNKIHPKAVYIYSVDGKEYEGTRIYLTDGPYESVEAKDGGIEISVYPPKGAEMETLTLRPGQPLTVYYNKHLPQESVLVRYGLGDLKKFMILGIVGIIVGLAMLAKALTTEEFD